MNDTAAKEHYEKLRRMYLQAPVNQYYSPSIHVDRGTCEISMEIRKDFFHSAGAAHGSIYFKLLDDSAYFAAASVDSKHHFVTAQFDIHFIRPVAQGALKAVGTLIYRTVQSAVAEAKAFDYKGRLVATGMGTFVPSHAELNESVGYV